MSNDVGFPASSKTTQMIAEGEEKRKNMKAEGGLFGIALGHGDEKKANAVILIVILLITILLLVLVFGVGTDSNFTRKDAIAAIVGLIGTFSGYIIGQGSSKK